MGVWGGAKWGCGEGPGEGVGRGQVGVWGRRSLDLWGHCVAICFGSVVAVSEQSFVPDDPSILAPKASCFPLYCRIAFPECFISLSSHQ